MCRDVKRNKLMEGKSTGVIKHDKPGRNFGSGSSEAIDYGKNLPDQGISVHTFFSFLFISVCVTAHSQRQYGRCRGLLGLFPSTL